MTDDFAAVADLAGALIKNVSPGERRMLLRAMPVDVRKDQAARIAGQEQPDGSAFEPRKVPETKARGCKGTVRRAAMFRKLRLAKHLRAGTTAGEAWVGFSDRVVRIASVDQEGLSDTPTRGGKKVRYARRVLLGLTNADQNRIIDMILIALK